MSEKKENSLGVAKKTLKYFLPIAWKLHKGYFFLGIAKTVLNAVYPFIPILILPLIIQELLGERDLFKMLAYVVIIVAGQGIINLASPLLNIQMEKYDERFQNYFTCEMSRRIMELDFQLTENKDALDQAEKARTGMSWYSGGVHGICTDVFNCVSEIIRLAGSVVLIALNAPFLFVITLTLTALNVLRQNKLNKIELESYQNLSKTNRIFSYLGWELQNFRYAKDIRLYGAKDMMVEKVKYYNDKQTDEWARKANATLPFELIGNVFSAARDIATYFYLGITVITGGMTIPIFTQMLSVGGTFHNSTQSLMDDIQQLVKNTSYAYEYVKFMNYPAAIEKGDLHVKNQPHTIEFKNVSFTYPNTDVKVLDGVSITLEQGEHLSVVGLNGAGKTTFVKLLCRLYDPTDGEILLDGINIKKYDYEEYMQLFSPVFQDFKLFSFTLKENIALDSDCENSEIERLAESVGLKDKLNSLEKGADTVLFRDFDENGVEPSGGEQQKIAIARALYKKSPVVILDEPTAALDPIAEYDIYRQFDSLVGGKTAIYISHRLSSCKFCDKVAVFDGGRVAEYGTHDQLVEIKGGLYARMFAAQAKYYN